MTEMETYKELLREIKDVRKEMTTSHERIAIAVADSLIRLEKRFSALEQNMIAKKRGG